MRSGGDPAGFKRDSNNSSSALNHLSHLFCDANNTSAATLVLQNLQKAAFADGEGRITRTSCAYPAMRLEMTAATGKNRRPLASRLNLASATTPMTPRHRTQSEGQLCEAR
jgi:hypothetical protein